MAEPLFVFFNDCLPENHPLLSEVSLHCVDCQEMVLCLDEVMDAFLLTGIGPVCLNCFTKRYNNADPIWVFDELELPNA